MRHLTLRFPPELRRVEVADGTLMPVGAPLTPADEAALVAVRATPPPRPVLLNSHWTTAERQAGRALLAALPAAPVRELLQHRLGAGEARGELVPLLIQLPTAELQAAPWELLADRVEGEPAEIAERAAVARQVPGGVASLPAASPRLRVAMWTPTPEDPICFAQLAEIDELAVIHTGQPALLIQAEAWAPADGALMVFVVAHGERVGEAVSFWRADGSLDAGAAGHWLLPWLKRASIVVLATCWGGMDTPEPSDVPGPRFVGLGARAVVAPRLPCSVSAASRFARGLIGALTRGRPVLDAVVAGRREVAGAGAAHEDSRWHNHRLFLADPGVTTWVPVRPPPPPPVAALLERALAEARISGRGYAGVEHLVLALRGDTSGSALGQYLRVLLGERVSRLLDQTQAFSAAATEPRWTPRMARSIAEADGDLDKLLRIVACDPGHRLHELVRDPLLPGGVVGRGGGGTVWTMTRTQMDGAEPTLDVDRPLVLEVLGGPEDGRRIPLSPGLRIGAVGDEVDVPLYADTSCNDPRLPGRGLRVVDATTVEGAHSVVLRRARRDQTCNGPISLEAGDALLLTRGTRLRVRTDEP